MIWRRASFLILFLLAGSFPSSYAANEPIPDANSVGRFALHADTSLPARTVSFGQVFLPGTVRRGDSLQIMLDGNPAPTQVDPKAFNADGSIRHAVLTVELPKLRSGQDMSAAIVRKTNVPPPAALPVDMTLPPFAVAVSLKDGGAVRKFDLDLQTIARNPKNAVAGFWLNGPLAQERRYIADVTEHLQVLFDVFVPKNGPARIDVIFHNDWTGTRREGNLDYDVDMTLAGASVYQARGVHHYTFAAWHHVLWTDGKDTVRITPDLATLEAAAAVPRYAADFSIASDIMSDLEGEGNKLSDKPMSAGTIARHMPDTGGRWDIGPLPTWSVADLLNGDKGTRKLVLANGDAAGAVPWHLRDRKTGLPLSIDAHPRTWLDPRGTGTVAEGVVPEPFEQENHGWTMDDAHQPSLSYYPYLLTGSQYYRDELAMQAAFVLLSYDDGYRGGAQGYIMGKDNEAWNQVRGLAWSLRTLANAAFVLPASYPMRDYFDAKLKANLAKLTQIYVQERQMKAAGPLEGWVKGVYRPDEATAPWQQGFLAVVLTWANDMGYADAGKMVGWMSNFLAGLFTNADQGFDPVRGGPAYILIVTKDERPINSWGAVFKASELDQKSDKEITEYWTSYGRIMQAALGGALSINHAPRIQKAYDLVEDRTDKIIGRNSRGDPTFAIVPRSTAAH